MIATVYAVSVPAINKHLKRIFADNEHEEAAVIKQYLTTAVDDKNHQVKHYSLQAIIAVGYCSETPPSAIPDPIDLKYLASQ